MRKTIVRADSGSTADSDWLDLEELAAVEVTSEDPNFPVESVFAENGIGWRASEEGEQRIRVIFNRPVSLRRIKLSFSGSEAERTQEFVLRWSTGGGPAREIVRQQWNFSPTGAMTETEDYTVDLHSVGVLELSIQPDINSHAAIATLASWRVA